MTDILTGYQYSCGILEDDRTLVADTKHEMNSNVAWVHILGVKNDVYEMTGNDQTLIENIKLGITCG